MCRDRTRHVIINDSLTRLILLGVVMFFQFRCRQLFVMLFETYMNGTLGLADIFFRTNIAPNDVNNAGLITLRFFVVRVFFGGTNQTMLPLFLT